MSPEIQQLRFDYHKKKLAETVKKIKYRIREDKQRVMSVPHEYQLQHEGTKAKTAVVKSQSLAAFLEYEQKKLNKAKEEQRETLLKTYKSSVSVSPRPAPTATDEAETLLKDDLAKKKEAFERKQQQHKARIEEIKHEKARFQRDLVRNMTMSMKEHEERGRKYEEQKKALVLARAASYSQKKLQIAGKLKEQENSFDQLLDAKLVEIEEKIAKNRTLHSEEMRKKAEIAARLSEGASPSATSFPSHRSSNEVERIKQYITAQQQAHSRKQELVNKQMAQFQERQTKVESKLSKIKQLKKIENEEQLLRIKQLERRMKTASLVMERKEKAWEKDMELRMEHQRLLDEDKRTKVERAQRIYNNRREKLVEKLLRDKEKVETIWKDKALRQSKHQETAIKIMIEKEKTRELQALLTRSPKSKTAQDKLKSMEIRVRRDSESSREGERVVIGDQ